MPEYASDVDRANWMAEVFAARGDFLLSDILIPGSHDTGTYGIGCDSDYEAGADGDASLLVDSVIKTILDFLGIPVDCYVAGLSRSQDEPVNGKVHAGWNLDYCLDGAGVNLSNNGRRIQLWQCDQVSETWRFDAPGRLQARWAPEMCLDVEGDDPTSVGAEASLGSCASGAVEEWRYPN